MIKRYRDERAINGLHFDQQKETKTAEAFTKNMEIAGRKFQENPLYSLLISNWNRVISAIPDFLDSLQMAVEEENS